MDPWPRISCAPYHVGGDVRACGFNVLNRLWVQYLKAHALGPAEGPVKGLNLAKYWTEDYPEKNDPEPNEA